MSVQAIGFPDAAVSSVLPAERLTHRLAARLRRAGAVAIDLLLLIAIVSCLPFVILAVGAPIALFVELLLRIARLL